MSPKRKRVSWLGGIVLTLACGVVASAAVYIAAGRDADLTSVNTWQRMSSPGPLSSAHAFLENNCAACHTPVKGVEASSCIVCHANNESVLKRQPTSFHADVSSCHECHAEHGGLANRPTEMSHVALTKIGLRQLLSEPDRENEGRITASAIKQWINQQVRPATDVQYHDKLAVEEKALNCAACHKNDDRHFSLFGLDCAQCHATDRWTIPRFIHPRAGSMDCAQCHQAPPSHYMMHFKMISQKVAAKPHARVDQCHACHQTTSWSDIKGVGVYKHH